MRIRKHRPDSGFSMVELLIVVAMIGIASMFALPMLRNMGRASQIRAAARQWMGDVRQLRQTCVSQMARGRIEFTTGPTGRTYQAYLSLDKGATWEPSGPQRTLGGDVYFVSTTFEDEGGLPAPDVLFFPNGSLAKADGTLSSGDVVIQIPTSAVQWNRYTLSHTSTGQISVARSHV
ncbi:MAG TPA: prepilin-type N-terminal cleavage/methylation domain-containing protein [Thermoanaerobaculia bacterium]|nr:prepilin-type N-terminal cleavage/methylation domain-containing protein [Thermoanaerobaculia bacterium]